MHDSNSEIRFVDPDPPQSDLVGEDRAYHRDRARAELDMAYRATTRAAAEAHLRLSSLHMRRLKDSP